MCTALLRAAEDRFATATEISQAVPALYGQHIRAGTIRQWRTADASPPDRHTSTTPPPAPRYRVGDVLDLARDAQQRQQRTAS